MSIRSAPYYWLECDSCAARCPDSDDEIQAWASREAAVDYARDNDWSITKKRQRCRVCTEVPS